MASASGGRSGQPALGATPRRVSLVFHAFLVAHAAAIVLSITGPSSLKAGAKAYVDPLFTQDWQLFAPEPINADTSVALVCSDGRELLPPAAIRLPELGSILDHRALWRTTISKSSLVLFNALQKRGLQFSDDGSAVVAELRKHPVEHLVLARSVLATVPLDDSCQPDGLHLRAISVRSGSTLADVTIPIAI